MDDSATITPDDILALCSAMDAARPRCHVCGVVADFLTFDDDDGDCTINAPRFMGRVIREAYCEKHLPA